MSQLDLPSEALTGRTRELGFLRGFARESAASGPRTGATASPVNALLIRRIADVRGAARPARDAVQPAGRLRQVIHMYCVQICSTTSNCMSCSGSRFGSSPLVHRVAAWRPSAARRRAFGTRLSASRCRSPASAT